MNEKKMTNSYFNIGVVGITKEREKTWKENTVS